MAIKKGFAIENVRDDFPNLKIQVHGKPLVYLDNAATTLKPQAVIDAVTEHYTKNTSNVHRGVHTLSQEATIAFEKSRDKIRDFIGAEKSSQIVFTRGATEAINLVANSYGRAFLQEGDEIIISEMEHHSDIVPWQILCESTGCILKIAPFNDQGELIFEEFEKLLSKRTKLIGMVYVSNSLGTINPVKKVIDAAHQAGAVVLIDGAQTISHRSVNVRELDCDFFVFSGHKIFGPTGVGALYAKEELLDKMPPYQGGGDMIASVTFEKTTYNVLPYKFEAGTPNIAGVIGLGVAIDYVQSLGMNNIIQHENDLLAYGTKALDSVEGLRLIGTAMHKASILSFVLPNIHPHDLGTLIDEEGIAIRTGHHCTQPVMNHFHIPATSRASLAIYNTKEEIDKLVMAINKAKEIFK